MLDVGLLLFIELYLSSYKDFESQLTFFRAPVTGMRVVLPTARHWINTEFKKEFSPKAKNRQFFGHRAGMGAHCLS
jgi:hypothetical protein